MSLLVRLICCRIILTTNSPWRLLICRSLVIHLLVLPPVAFRSSEVGRLLLDLDPYGALTHCEWVSGVLPTTEFAYRKGLGTCDALLCVSRTLQSALESGQEARIVQIDFSAAFDRVNHLGILYKLCSVGIEISVLSILTQFISNLSQLVMVDGCRSKLVNVVSGVPHGSVLGP